MIRLLRTPLSRGPGRLLVGGLALVLAPSAGWAAGDLEAGKVKAKACAVCHGIDGIAKRPDAPNLAGQNDFYLAGQLRNYRSGKRIHAEMGIIAKDLSDQDIEDLVRYYAAIEITVTLPE